MVCDSMTHKICVEIKSSNKNKHKWQPLFNTFLRRENLSAHFQQLFLCQDTLCIKTQTVLKPIGPQNLGVPCSQVVCQVAVVGSV